MASNLTITGNLQYPTSPNAQNSVEPLNLQFAFTMLMNEVLNYTSPVSDEEINLGTISNPKAFIVECLRGSFTLKLNTADTGEITLSISETPVTGERAIFQIINPAGMGSIAPVITVAEDAKLKVTVVQ